MGDLVLITGATGYVGGRLLRRLQEAGASLRCLARSPGSLGAKAGANTEIVEGDLLSPESLRPALEGVETAYYLVHSLGASEDFERMERECARNFARAAKEAGVRRIVYLGGLGSNRGELSPHLRSRHEVGDVLKSSGCEVIELRASIVIGSGSLSFEMVRSLTERLPVMITPRWVDVLAQPIAIDDLLAYLVEAAELPAGPSRVYEIGGADQVSYGQLMNAYAELRGLRRTMIRVPVLTPRLSSLWLGLITPLYARIGKRLVESIRHPTVVSDPAAQEAFSVRPMSMRRAIERALANEDQEAAETRWYDAQSSGSTRSWAGVRFRTRIADVRSKHVDVAPDAAFRPIQQIGGRRGWYAFNWLWRVRGTLDLLLGGVGMRRGRRHPVDVEVGDALDFWRVEAFEPGRLLRLSAEMKVPGRAWLELAVEPDGDGARIHQRAIFDPLGLWGLVYWYGVFPLHALIFRRMLSSIAEAASNQPRVEAVHG